MYTHVHIGYYGQMGGFGVVVVVVVVVVFCACVVLARCFLLAKILMFAKGQRWGEIKPCQLTTGDSDFRYRFSPASSRTFNQKPGKKISSQYETCDVKGNCSGLHV